MYTLKVASFHMIAEIMWKPVLVLSLDNWQVFNYQNEWEGRCYNYLKIEA